MPQEGATTRPVLPHDTAPWTASRCLRILRRLESRLASLRKLIDRSEDVPHAPVTAERGAKRPGLGANEDGEPRKRPRNTYGGRNKKKRAASTDPQHETSPRAVRTLRAMKPRSCSLQPGFPSEICASSLQREPIAAHYQHRKALDSRVDQQRQQLQAHQEKSRIHSDILASLRSFLESTQVADGEPHQRSLLGMCLRKIPACIDDIEAWDKAMASDQARKSIRQTSDAALDIYSQLEAFGAAGLGWRPLKQTLRSHGLWTLRKAAAEALFCSTQTAQLVRVCLQFGLIDEATHLALAVNKGDHPFPRSANDSLDEHTSLEPLHALLAPERLNKDMRPGPMFDGVSKMIKEKQLPVAWLSTQGLAGLFVAAIHAISGYEECTAALNTITAVVTALCDNRKKATWHNAGTRLKTLSRIAAGLSSAGQDPSTKMRPTFALDCCLNEMRSQNGPKRSHELFILSLARFLATEEQVVRKNGSICEKQHVIEGMDVQADGSQTVSPLHFRQVMSLLCSIAQESSRRTLAPAYESLMEMSRRLEHLPWPTWVSVSLRRDGAFELAQRTNDLRDLAFAEGQVPHEQTTAPGQGWYWEEAIGEFVVRSPEKQEGDSWVMAQARTRSQTRHRPPESPQSSHGGQAADKSVSDPADDPGIANIKCGTTNDSDGEQINISADEDNSTVMTSVGEENEQDSRVYASSTSPETGEQGKLQGPRAAARRGPGLATVANASLSLSPAPICGARQLFIVRGSGRRNVGEDDDWLEW